MIRREENMRPGFGAIETAALALAAEIMEVISRARRAVLQGVHEVLTNFFLIVGGSHIISFYVGGDAR